MSEHICKCGNESTDRFLIPTQQGDKTILTRFYYCSSCAMAVRREVSQWCSAGMPGVSEEIGTSKIPDYMIEIGGALDDKLREIWEAEGGQG